MKKVSFLLGGWLKLIMVEVKEVELKGMEGGRRKRKPWPELRMVSNG